MNSSSALFALKFSLVPEMKTVPGAGQPPEFLASERIIATTARVAGLAPQAYLVLVALLAQSAHAENPPTSVRIATRGGAASVDLLSLTWDGLRTDGLPVRIDRVTEGLPLEVHIEFASPVPPDSVADIDEAFTVWDHLVFLGGYRFSFEPDEEDFEVVLGDTTQPTRTSVRHFIETFKGPLLALDGPLWISRHLVRAGYPINEILMES